MNATKPRYFVQFTPVGWQVRDRETGDEMAAFGTGDEEYARAKAQAADLNYSDEPRGRSDYEAFGG